MPLPIMGATWHFAFNQLSHRRTLWTNFQIYSPGSQSPSLTSLSLSLSLSLSRSLCLSFALTPTYWAQLWAAFNHINVPALLDNLFSRFCPPISPPIFLLGSQRLLTTCLTKRLLFLYFVRVLSAFFASHFFRLLLTFNCPKTSAMPL